MVERVYKEKEATIISGYKLYLAGINFSFFKMISYVFLIDFK